jgi:hypothetical protein
MADPSDTPPSGAPAIEEQTPVIDETTDREAHASDADPFAERPELFVGAAFVGGFALAQILKRIGK